MSAPAPARKRSRGCLWRLFWLAVATCLLAGAAGVVGVVTLFRVYGTDLPDIRNVHDYRPRELTTILSAEGHVIAELIGEDAIRRTVIGSDQIPDVMRQAIIAAEDQHFYEHAGLDWVGLARAILTNLRRGQLSQGASTITQQLVKNLVLSPERSIRRKVQEALLAFEMERHLTKDEILTIYLNHIFFGVQYYGVQQASLYYFGHGASELTLTEAALLAGLPQSPNQYNPFRNPERATERRAYVLRRMYESGNITESVYREAVDAPLGLRDPDERSPWLNRFPDYVDAVVGTLRPVVDEERIFGGGLRIETPLRVELQLAAMDAVQQELRALDERTGHLRPRDTVDVGEIEAWRSRHADDAASGLQRSEQYVGLVLSSDEESTLMALGNWTVQLDRSPESRLKPDEDTPWDQVFAPGAVFTVVPMANHAQPPAEGHATVQLVPPAQAALASIDPATREIVALVGSYEAQRGGFNRAIQATRQVGSTFKAFVYAAALEQRLITPATVYLDQPFTARIAGQPDWRPANYDGEYLGPMSARQALATSRNVIAVRVLEQLGVTPMHEFAARVGARSPLVDNLTLALGSAEMTPLELTNMFATLAAGGVAADPILVRRVLDSRGELVWAPQPPAQTRVLDPAVTWLTTSMLQSVVTSGTGGSAQRVGHPIAGKTGTTNGARDAWFVGYSRTLVTGVWVGRDDNTELGRRESGGRAALPIFTNFMSRALADVTPEEILPRPETGLVDVLIDPATGLRANEGREGAIVETFLAGTEPREFAPEAGSQPARDVLFRGQDPPTNGSADSAAPPQGTLDEF